MSLGQNIVQRLVLPWLRRVFCSLILAISSDDHHGREGQTHWDISHSIVRVRPDQWQVQFCVTESDHFISCSSRTYFNPAKTERSDTSLIVQPG